MAASAYLERLAKGLRGLHHAAKPCQHHQLSAEQVGAAFLSVCRQLARWAGTSNGMKPSRQAAWGQQASGASGLRAASAAAALTLRGLELPLRHRVRELSTTQAMSVLSAWARSRQYAPPTDLVMAVSTQLQRHIGAMGSSTPATSSTAAPAYPAVQSNTIQEQRVRPWQQAFVPYALFHERHPSNSRISDSASCSGGGGDGSSSSIRGGSSSSSSSSVDAAGGTAAAAAAISGELRLSMGDNLACRLEAAAVSVVSLSFIWERAPDHPQQVAAALERMAAAVLGLLQEQVQHAQDSSNASSADHSGSTCSSGQYEPEAARPGAVTVAFCCHRAVNVLWGISRLPSSDTVNRGLLQPLLELVLPRIVHLDSLHLIYLLQALASLQSGSRPATAQQLGGSSSNDGGGGGVYATSSLAADDAGEHVMDDGWRPGRVDGRRQRHRQQQRNSGASSAAIGRSSSDGTSLSAASMPADLSRLVNSTVVRALQRLTAVAPQLSVFNAATAASSIAALCGPHHKFAGDHVSSGVAHTVRPMAALADSIIARPAYEPVPAPTVSRLVGAYAALMHGHTALFERLADDALAAGIDAFLPSQVAALAWGFAATNTCHPRLMAAITAWAAQCTASLSYQQLCNLLWSCVVLNHDDPVFLAAAERTVKSWPLHQLHWSLMSQLLQVHNMYALLHDRRILGQLAPHHQQHSGSSRGSSSSGGGGSAIRSRNGMGSNGGDDGGGSSSSSDVDSIQSNGVNDGGGGSGFNGTGLPNPPIKKGPLFELPREALRVMRRTVARERAPFQLSAFHRQVLDVLSSDLQLKVNSEVTLLEGGVSVDALVLYQGELVAVETDGPWHYTRSAPHRRNGKSALRDRLLAAAGFPVVEVPVRLWTRLRSRQRAPYLRNALDVAVRQHRAHSLQRSDKQESAPL